MVSLNPKLYFVYFCTYLYKFGRAVEILDEVEEHEYGKFVHILDPEGNKIELWEPVDRQITDNQDEQSTF